MDILLLAVFGLVFVINLIYYLFYLNFISKKQKALESSQEAPLSVILYLKNNQESLHGSIDLILEQDYKNYELIIVNDSSIDDSIFELEELEKQHPQIKLVDVKSNEHFWGNKKYALTLGIKRASSQNLVFVSPQFKPTNKNWLKSISLQAKDKQVELGYYKYQANKSLGNVFARFYHMKEMVLSFANLKSGLPYYTNFYNKSYKASLYYEHSGFMDFMKIPEAENNLFIQEIANKENTFINFDADNFVVEKAPFFWKTWYENHKQSLKNKKLISSSQKMGIRIFPITEFLLLPLFVMLAFINLLFFQIAAIAIIVRFVIQFLFYRKSTLKLQEPYLIWLFPILNQLTNLFYLHTFFNYLRSRQ